MSNKATPKKLNTENIISLASFFDLLAKFDFEDQKNKSASNSNSLVSAPRKLELKADITK